MDSIVYCKYYGLLPGDYIIGYGGVPPGLERRVIDTGFAVWNLYFSRVDDKKRVYTRNAPHSPYEHCEQERDGWFKVRRSAFVLEGEGDYAL